MTATTRSVPPPPPAIAAVAAAWHRNAAHACYWCGRAMPDSAQGKLCCSPGCFDEAEEAGAL